MCLPVCRWYFSFPGHVCLRAGSWQEGWRNWALLDHLDTPAGQPRRRPKRLRRWLERHALLIALLGLLMLAGSAVFWAITLLPATGWFPVNWMERWPWN